MGDMVKDLHIDKAVLHPMHPNQEEICTLVLNVMGMCTMHLRSEVFNPENCCGSGALFAENLV